MFSRDRSLRASSFNRASDANAVITTGKTDISAVQKKTQTNMRTLRGYTGAITALHCVTRKEVWDLVGDREDAGFFISGSTDCTVSLKLVLLCLSLYCMITFCNTCSSITVHLDIKHTSTLQFRASILC